MKQSVTPLKWRKPVAIIALLFGSLTLFKSGSLLFAPEGVLEAVGRFVPFVLWFNFGAGFFYILAAIGIWFGKSWAFRLSVLIVLGTLITAARFAVHIGGGGGYEMQTVGALVLRIGFWFVVALLLHRSTKHFD